MYFPPQCVDPIIYPKLCYGNNQLKKTTALNSNYIQIKITGEVADNWISQSRIYTIGLCHTIVE